MNHKRSLDAQKVPFFARYLEAQSPQDILAEEAEKVRGGLPLLPVRPIRDGAPGMCVECQRDMWPSFIVRTSH